MKAGEAIEEKVPTEAPIDSVVKLRELYKELNKICKQEYKMSQDFIRTINIVRGRPLATPSPKLSRGTTTIASNHPDEEALEYPNESNNPKYSMDFVVHATGSDNPKVVDDITTYSDPVKSSDNITNAEETVPRNDSREDNKPPVLPDPVTDDSHINNLNYDLIMDNSPDTNSMLLSDKFLRNDSREDNKTSVLSDPITDDSHKMNLNYDSIMGNSPDTKNMLLSDKFPTSATTSIIQCDQTEAVTADHEESR